MKGESWSAGGPLYSTPRDDLTFTRMLLHGGSVNGQRILKPETVALMNRNSISSRDRTDAAPAP